MITSDGLSFEYQNFSFALLLRRGNGRSNGILIQEVVHNRTIYL